MPEYTPRVSDSELRRMFAANGITDQELIERALTIPRYREVYESQYRHFVLVERELAAHGESSSSRLAGRGGK